MAGEQSQKIRQSARNIMVNTYGDSAHSQQAQRWSAKMRDRKKEIIGSRMSHVVVDFPT